MADDDDGAKTSTFRTGHLVRLHGFNHAALDCKLVRRVLLSKIGTLRSSC